MRDTASGPERSDRESESAAGVRETIATFVLNGDAHALPDDARLATLLDTLALRAEWVLVELNGEPVPREQYDATTLRAGDRLELVTPLAGG
ncbi:MAG: sulfur carrier protein ThiS [bacterium]